MGRRISSTGFCVGWSYFSSSDPPMMNFGEGDAQMVEFSPAFPYHGLGTSNLDGVRHGLKLRRAEIAIRRASWVGGLLAFSPPLEVVADHRREPGEMSRAVSRVPGRHILADKVGLMLLILVLTASENRPMIRAAETAGGTSASVT